MMKTRTEAIRAAARRLLEAGKVDAVIGYTQGTIPLRAQPFIAYTPEDCDKLIWSSFCGGNLATIASGRKDRVAVVAQGCVSRNLNGLVHEKRINRDNLYIIGVPCIGMLDQRKVEAKLMGRNIELLKNDPEEDLGEITVSGCNAVRECFVEVIKRRDVKRDNCYTCMHRNPVGADEVVTEPVSETAGGDINAVATPWARFETDRRWEEFTKNFEDCIRCYACRDVCPLCYCTTCFVDESNPQWCGKTQDPADVQTFHILRAFHCAGRCTDCGACESACPQGIKMRRLTSMLEKDVRAKWNHEPGMDCETKPPLSTYRPDDPEDHFK
jgi:ferredoxin